MIDTSKLSIRQPQEAYVFKYPLAEELADKQCSIFWTHTEIPVENDKQDLLVNMSDAERKAIITTLKLFTQYELILGGEVWGDKLFNAYPRPELQRMCNAFSFFELNVHAPFYAKLNQVLRIDTEEFYLSYHKDPVLEDRIAFIHEAIASEDLLFALACFTMMENTVLYSNFAFIKHFQSRGKNMLANVVSGINFSARDENLHATGGAWLFNETIDAVREETEYTEKEINLLNNKIVSAAYYLYEHEARIIDLLFSNGPIQGIEAWELENFVKSRVDMTLKNMRLEPIFNVLDDNNPIADWFYDSINGTQLHDFFAITGNEYSRTIGEEELSF